MAKKSYPIPNLENMTDGGLVDLLGQVREQMAEAKFYEGFYKEVLTSRLAGRTVLPGENFELQVVTYPQSRFSVEVCRAAIAKGDEEAARTLAKYSISTDITQFRVGEIVKPNVALTQVKAKVEG